MESKNEQVKKQQKEQTQTLKTAGIFVFVNTLLTPLWMAENAISKGVALVVNMGLFYQLHEYGKSNRLLENTAHNTSKFFSPIIPNSTPTINSIENAVSNIIEGGALTIDEVQSKLSKK